MACVVDAIVSWFAENLWERLLLCAETVAIVLGGLWALRRGRSLNRKLSTQSEQLTALRRDHKTMLNYLVNKLGPDDEMVVRFAGKGGADFQTPPPVSLTRAQDDG